MTKNFALSGLSSSAVYALMTQVIIPRPIAWILSRNANGSWNLAPFSYFAAVSSEPPLVMVSIGHKVSPDHKGILKDTATNILRERQCVIHMACYEDLGLVQQTAEELSDNESEVERFGIGLMDQDDFPVPRVKAAPVALNAVYSEHHVRGAASQHIFYLEIVSLSVTSALVSQAQGRTVIDPKGLDPLGRLGAGFFSGIDRIVKAPKTV